MSSNFTYDEISLKDAVEFIVDNRGKTVPTEENGIPLIATSSINNKDLYPIKEKLRYVSQETYKNWFRSHPKPNDIIITNKGSQNGAVCLVPDPVDFCIAQDMVALRADKKKIDPTYLFAALRSSLVQNRIKGLNVDAVIPHFKKTDFDKLFIPLPNRKTQEFIGQVYFDFCRKIELNNRINQTLELTAQAIFKSWFVDFDPVKAKVKAIEKGEDPELVAMQVISGKSKKATLELPNNIIENIKKSAKLFPSKLVNSTIGKIPEGWDVVSFGDVASNYKEGIKPETQPATTPYIGLEHIEKKNIYLSNWGFACDVESNKSKFYKDDILFGKLRPYFHKVSYIPFEGICSTDILVVRAISTEWQGYVQSQLFDKVFVEYANVRSTGTRMPRAKWKDMAEYEIAKPNIELAKLFSNLVLSNNQIATSNILESKSLSQLRDTLLPKLLSGELTLPTAEAQIEKATA